MNIFSLHFRNYYILLYPFNGIEYTIANSKVFDPLKEHNVFFFVHGLFSSAKYVSFISTNSFFCIYIGRQLLFVLHPSDMIVYNTQYTSVPFDQTASSMSHLYIQDCLTEHHLLTELQKEKRINFRMLKYRHFIAHNFTVPFCIMNFI